MISLAKDKTLISTTKGTLKAFKSIPICHN